MTKICVDQAEQIRGFVKEDLDEYGKVRPRRVKLLRKFAKFDEATHRM